MRERSTNSREPDQEGRAGECLSIQTRIHEKSASTANKPHIATFATDGRIASENGQRMTNSQQSFRYIIDFAPGCGLKMLIGLEGAQGFCVSIFGLDQIGNPQGMKWLAARQIPTLTFTPLTRGHEVAQLSASRRPGGGRSQGHWSCADPAQTSPHSRAPRKTQTARISASSHLPAAERAPASELHPTHARSGGGSSFPANFPVGA